VQFDSALGQGLEHCQLSPAVDHMTGESEAHGLAGTSVFLGEKAPKPLAQANLVGPGLRLGQIRDLRPDRSQSPESPVSERIV
jgi:hypothetical protein